MSVWSTPWLIDGERLRIPLMKNILVDLNLKVSDLMIPNSDLWDHQKLENLFYDQDIEIIFLRLNQQCLLLIFFAGTTPVQVNTL